MKGQKAHWKRALRRCAALFFATVTVWLLGLTCDFGAACARLGESAAFVSALLRFELGQEDWGNTVWSDLDNWQRLALGQSALLRSGAESVSLSRPGQTAETPEEDGHLVPSEGEDDPEPSLPRITAAPDDIVEQNLSSGEGTNFHPTTGVSLHNYTNKAVDMEALAAVPITVKIEEAGPQVLIMHTHTSEAYTMDGTDIYIESDASRTVDEAYNMLRIGDEIQRVFEELGLEVVHDRTLYDYPHYSGAYDRSYAGVKAWLEKYPSIKVVLDVHRDALIGEDGTVYKAVTEVDGEKTAQVMMVLGSDDAGLDHPHWQENLALAIRIQQSLEEQWPTLARPIALRSSRFNQQLTTGSLLVEVGSHGNTLQEALRGARLFAQTAGEVLLELA